MLNSANNDHISLLRKLDEDVQCQNHVFFFGVNEARGHYSIYNLQYVYVVRSFQKHSLK